MTNPLADRRKVETAATAGRHLKPGETLTINDTEHHRVLTLHRTTRDYVHDLCDAYNDAMGPDARRRGCRWMVGSDGALFLGFPQDFSTAHTRQMDKDKESERRRWLWNFRNPIDGAPVQTAEREPAMTDVGL